MTTNDSMIYDFETLSQDGEDGVVLSVAILSFNRKFLHHDYYQYGSLLDQTHYLKFDVNEQVKKYGRKIDRKTLDWWGKQSKEAREVLKPSSEEVSIDRLFPWIVERVMIKDLDRVYTRNNTFDPLFLRSICRQTGYDTPYPFWHIRDTKSVIDGLTWDNDEIKDNFIPEELEEKFVAHDPRHDIVMDVMRLQKLTTALFGEIPF